MNKVVISFTSAAMCGFEGDFNTIRLGSTYFKKLNVGDRIFLMNEKAKEIFAEAEVLKVDTGPLGEMCVIHASSNHASKTPEGLFALVQKIYGPHIATFKKISSVVYLRIV